MEQASCCTLRLLRVILNRNQENNNEQYSVRFENIVFTKLRPKTGYLALRAQFPQSQKKTTK
jgi:hypothetical protein